MIKSFRSKPLKRFWTKGDRGAVDAAWIAKIIRILDALEAAATPIEMDILGFGFHALTGDLDGRYSVIVTRNWRITFDWRDDGAENIDLEDYHGQ